MKKFISVFLIVTMLASVFCFSAAAEEGTVYINEEFVSADSVNQNFFLGGFVHDDAEQIVYAYSDAITFSSVYSDPEGPFEDTPTTWATYDTTVSVCVGEDEFFAGEDRTVILSYCNDNPLVEGLAEGRIFMNFSYDIVESCFTFQISTEEDLRFDPVSAEIVCDGTEYFTMGMSVTEGRVRCFYNDQLIFDFVDSANEFLIGKAIESPVLFWNCGNFVKINNVKIASPEHLFPIPAETETTLITESPVDGTEGTDAPVDNTDAPVDNTDAPVDNTDAPADNTDAPADNTDAPEADTVGTTGTQKPSTSTGDATFVVVAAMVAALGSALIVKKVRG